MSFIAHLLITKHSPDEQKTLEPNLQGRALVTAQLNQPSAKETFKVQLPLGFACEMLGKSEPTKIIPNGGALMVIYHGIESVTKKSPQKTKSKSTWENQRLGTPKRRVDGSDDFPFQKRVIFRFPVFIFFGGVNQGVVVSFSDRKNKT